MPNKEELPLINVQSAPKNFTNCSICRKPFIVQAKLSCCQDVVCLDCIIYNQKYLKDFSCPSCKKQVIFVEKKNFKACLMCHLEISEFHCKNKSGTNLCKICYNKYYCWGCGIDFLDVPEKSIKNKLNDPYIYCEQCSFKRFCKTCGNQNYISNRRRSQMKEEQKQEINKKSEKCCIACEEKTICNSCQQNDVNFYINEKFLCTNCFYVHYCTQCGKKYDVISDQKFYIKMLSNGQDTTKRTAALQGNCCSSCYSVHQQQKCYDCKQILTKDNSKKYNEFEYYCKNCYDINFTCTDCLKNPKLKHEKYCKVCNSTCQLCEKTNVELNEERVCKKCFKEFYCNICTTNLIMLNNCYKKYSGLYFCLPCFTKSYCLQCKEKLSENNQFKKCDGYYCKKCVNFIFCQKCDKKIMRKTKEQKDKVPSKRRVSVMFQGTMIQQSQQSRFYIQQHKYCKCGPICENCGQYFNGKYLNTKNQKNIFCQHCKMYFWKTLDNSNNYMAQIARAGKKRLSMQ